MKQPKYVLRFFFDTGSGGCLWPENDNSYRDFDYGPYTSGDRLPSFFSLSEETFKRCAEICAWYENSLDWNAIHDPLLWRQEECDRFNAAVQELIKDIRQELGDDFGVIDRADKFQEDSDLDLFLEDPKVYWIKKDKPYFADREAWIKKRNSK